MAREFFDKYGLRWTSDQSELDIEMECIRRGGRWKLYPRDEKEVGAGLEHHYERMRNIIWPHLDDHRWHRLCRDSIIQNRVCVLMGPGSSGKTHEAAWIRLCEYYCFPNETCVLVSSTDMRGLQLRVWGEIKMLHTHAKEKFPDLPGHIIESRTAISTDDIEEGSVRDLRKGIIGIPCFPTGTIVDTPSGPRRIEGLQAGDCVFNASGIGTVTKTHASYSNRLVRVHLADGRSIDCTEDHPILSERGWTNAIDLKTSERVFSAHEAVRHLHGTFGGWISKPEALLGSVPEFNGAAAVPRMRRSLSTVQAETQSASEEILQPRMCLQMVGQAGQKTEINDLAGVSKLREGDSHGAPQSPILLTALPAEIPTSPLQTVWKGILVHRKPRQEIPFLRRVLQEELQWEEGGSTALHPDEVRAEGMERVQRVHAPLSPKNRAKELRRETSLVQLGHSVAGNQTGRRGRWGNPWDTIKGNKGLYPKQCLKGTWVDRVEVLEPRSDPRHEEGKGGYLVHNLEVDGHPSYSVNGIAVHNCVQGGKYVGLGKYAGIKQKRMRLIADEAQFMGLTFLSAFANLDKNPDFRAIVLGNPNDILDPLGKAAEPLDGWSSHLEPKKTSVWKTRFMGGICVNLIGTDSPNFDYPPDKPARFPYLISNEKINNTLSFFPKDSAEYYSQCVGAMKIGVIARRVLTRDLITKFGARDEVVWVGGKLTRVFALDAAYGGDRCVGGHADFGADINGNVVVRVYQPHIVPVIVRQDNTPEEQIAEWIKEYCETNDIPPENAFHDSTGRGGLGTAIARVWSASCNPVEFGGKPTPRPVSLEMFIYDPKEKRKRLKRCDEHYDRFVTELWWSIRLVVESQQMRGLTEDVAEELCMREWDKINEGKIKLETKKEMKLRVGRSPDLGDWLSIIIEGARRRGFQISKIGQEDIEAGSGVMDELNKLATKKREMLKAHALNHSA